MIYIDVINYRWETGKSLEEERAIAEDYIQRVRFKILSDFYESKWRSLNPNYAAYKAKHGLMPHMWASTGNLMYELKLKYGMVIGFDNRKIHPGSKKRYRDIARYLEYGTATIPARPLFRYVLWEMQDEIQGRIDEYGGDISDEFEMY